MKTKKIVLFMSILVSGVLTGCSDDKKDEPEIPDIILTEITDNSITDIVTSEEENRDVTDNDKSKI